MRYREITESEARKTATREMVQQFAERTKEACDLKEFSLFLRENGDLVLNMLAAKKKKQGAGTAAMTALVEFADQYGLRVILTLGMKDPLWGTTSRSRLIRFYKRFGFVENKGKNKDFSISGNMIRYPLQK